MENLKQLINKLKVERDDFSQQLGFIYGLLKQDETTAACESTGKVLERVEDCHNIVKIPYPIIAVMLNYKLVVAREEGIELRLNVKIPEELKVDEYELIIILGNLLDNAVKACRKIEDRNRYLDLSIRYKQEYLVIIVENPVIESQPGKEPLKQNRGNHIIYDIENKENFDDKVGYSDQENYLFGLSNIEYLLNKHNGIMKIEEENDVFKVDIALLTI